MKTKYIIIYEKLGSEYYYMIYVKRFFGWSFFERWNLNTSAIKRVEHLNRINF